MKKTSTISLFFLILVVALSCKKDHPAKSVTNPAGLYTLRLNVSDFSQQITNSTNKLKLNATASDSASISLLIDTLYFILYPGTNNSAYVYKQSKTDIGFGKFALKVSPGDYVLSVSGAKGVGIRDRYTLLDTISGEGWFDYDLDGSYLITTHWKTLYAYRTPVTIASADVNRSVTLTNVLSQVILNIKDAIPSSVKKITMDIDKFRDGYSTLHGKTEYVHIPGIQDQRLYSNSAAITAADIGKTNYKIYNTIACDSIVNVTVTCYNASKGIVAQKNINNIRVRPNEQVTLTGNMFGGGGGSPTTGGFDIKVNVGWDPTVITKTF